MKQNVIRFIYTVVFGILLSFDSQGQIQEFLSPNKGLEIALSEADEIKMKRILASKEQRREIAEMAGKETVRSILRYYEGTRENEITGYAIIDDVMGKHQPITYLVAFDPQLKITAVEILIYRESYGFEIRQDTFKNQFIGLGEDAPLTIGTDIRNISGATVSCRSLTQAIKEKVAYMNVLFEKKPFPEKKSLMKTVPLRKDPETDRWVEKKRVQMHMGTFLEIHAYGHNAAIIDYAITRAFERVNDLESKISSWQEDSLVGRFNKERSSDRIMADDDTRMVFNQSLEIYHQSEGAFDITIGPLMSLWKIAEMNHLPPSPAEIEKAMGLIGMNRIIHDRADQTLTLPIPGMRIDLGGIGKGYALKVAAEVLEQSGMTRALLNFGGQVLALDPPPGQSSWPVWIRNPFQEKEVLMPINLTRASVATSSSQERFFQFGNQKLNHILDPKTGFPSLGTASVSIIGKDPTSVDGWATALFIQGKDHLAAFRKSTGMDALLIDEKGNLYTVGDSFNSGAKTLSLIQ